MPGEADNILRERERQLARRIIADEQVRVTDDWPADERLILTEDDLRRCDVEVALDRYPANRRTRENVARLVRRDGGGPGTHLVKLHVIGGHDNVGRDSLLIGHDHRKIGDSENVVLRLEDRQDSDCSLGDRQLANEICDGWQLSAGGQHTCRATTPGLGGEALQPCGHRLDRSLRCLGRHQGDRWQTTEIEVRVRVGEERIVPGDNSPGKDARNGLGGHDKALKSGNVIGHAHRVAECRHDDRLARGAVRRAECSDIRRYGRAIDDCRGGRLVDSHLGNDLLRADRGEGITRCGHRAGKRLWYRDVDRARFAYDLRLRLGGQHIGRHRGRACGDKQGRERNEDDAPGFQ